MLNDGTYAITSRGIVPINTRDGYAISLPFLETRMKECHWGIIGAYIQLHADLLAKPGTYLGIWTDGDETVFDVSELHRVDLAEAKRIGRERNQKAIWDFANNQEVRL